MRIVRAFAAVLGGVLAAGIVGCSGAHWGVVADTSQPTELPGDSDSSHASSPPEGGESNQPVDLAETKHFKNRSGNAPLKADGFYDYNVAGFELFDICAELDGYDLAQHGLERFGSGAFPRYFGVLCSVQPVTDGPSEDFVTIYSARTPIEKLEEDGRLVKQSVNESGLEVLTYHASNSDTACIHSVSTPGGVVGVSSTGVVFRDFKRNCDRAEKYFDLLVIDLLLGEK